MVTCSLSVKLWLIPLSKKLIWHWLVVYVLCLMVTGSEATALLEQSRHHQQPPSLPTGIATCSGSPAEDKSSKGVVDKCCSDIILQCLVAALSSLTDLQRCLINCWLQSNWSLRLYQERLLSQHLYAAVFIVLNFRLVFLMSLITLKC